jgi:hypothetical protein
MVDLEGAPHALPGLARSHHEVLDEELAPAVEEIGERHFALWPAEDIALLDLHPGQGPPLGGQGVTTPCELLFLRQERLARREPFLARGDPVPGRALHDQAGHSFLLSASSW